jgi:hypothetical protein
MPRVACCLKAETRLVLAVFMPALAIISPTARIIGWRSGYLGLPLDVIRGLISVSQTVHRREAQAQTIIIGIDTCDAPQLYQILPMLPILPILPILHVLRSLACVV